MFEYSVEQLYHFQCSECNHWFSIADYTLSDQILSCPRCAHMSNEYNKSKPIDTIVNTINKKQYFVSGTYRRFDNMSSDYENIDFSNFIYLEKTPTIENIIEALQKIRFDLPNLKPGHIKTVNKL